MAYNVMPQVSSATRVYGGQPAVDQRGGGGIPPMARPNEALRNDFLLIVLGVGPIMRAEGDNAGRQFFKVVAMSEKRRSIDDINPGRVPCDCFDVETETEIIHVDTYDLEAARRYKAERARSAGEAATNPRSDQNAQHSG